MVDRNDVVAERGELGTDCGREVLVSQNSERHDTSYRAAFIRARPRW